jgi:peptidoglycan/LPS O-acetylase OafA/YrhL
VAQKSPPAYLPYFGLGFIVAAALQRWKPRMPGRLVASGFALIVLNAAWHASSHNSALPVAVIRDLPAGAGAALVIAGAVAGGGRWLAARPLTALGLVSYGFFLWQLPLILLLKRAGLFPTAFAPAFLVAFPVVVAVAAASWRFIERPLLTRGRRATIAP